MFEVIHKSLISFLVVVTGLSANADWTLDAAASHLSFVTTKNEVVAEAHRFADVTARVSDRGEVTATVSISSLDTLLEIRDQRMKEMLFEAQKFPVISYSTKLDLASILGLQVGSTLRLAQEGSLSLHGMSGTVFSDLQVLRAGVDRVVVSTVKPVIVNAGSFGLEEGVEKLREVAGLQRISPAVPVNFVLVFVMAK